ncbi:PAS domain S-box protein [Falsibacillus pallidus]|uniref:PAS domain S-box protein n=1 Tax=Falsibacillus pallidus TaxID=493781 RepID=UPI003D981815
MEYSPIRFSPFIVVMLSTLIPLVGSYTFFELFLVGRGQPIRIRKILLGTAILSIAVWSAAATSIISISGNHSFHIWRLAGAFGISTLFSFLSIFIFAKKPSMAIGYLTSGFILGSGLLFTQFFLEKSLIDFSISLHGIHLFWIIGSCFACTLLAAFIFYKTLAKNLVIFKYWQTLLLSAAMFIMNFITLAFSAGAAHPAVSGPAVGESNVIIFILFSMFLLVGVFLMISQIKQKMWEEQAEWKNVQLQSLFRQNPHGLIIFDRKGTFVRANPASQSITGYSADEIKGKSFTFFIYQEDTEKVKRYFKESLNGVCQNLEIKSRHKDGRELLLKVETFPILHNEAIVGIYCLIEDRTNVFQLETNLREKEEHYRLVSENTSDLVSVMTNKGKIEFASPSHKKILGYDGEFFIGQQINHFIHPDDFQLLLSNYRLMMRTTEPVVVHYRLKHRDGHYIPTESYAVPILDQKKKLIKMLVSSRDVTERMRHQEELQDSESKYRIIAEYSYDLIRVIDPAGIVQYASPSHEVVLGYSQDEIIGSTFDQSIHPEDRKEITSRFQQNLQNIKREILEYRLICKNGEMIWVEAHSTPVFDQTGAFRHFVVVSRNISERKLYESQLEQLAFYDLLTDIPNRRLFQGEFQTLLSRAAQSDTMLGLMLIDCDRFKWVNDTFGHDTGDALLREFVLRIKEHLLDSYIFARLGGDEFAILIPDSSKGDIDFFAEKIIEDLQSPWNINGHEFITTSSIGVSCSPNDGDTMDLLMAHADQALYHAKELGRNNYQWYSKEMERKMSRSLLIENGLKTALKHHRFHLVFQPQIHMLDEEMTGVEVLLRYEHPELGTISPMEFIPLCEQTGIIDEVTHWILTEAVFYQLEWKGKQYPPVKMAINISPLTIEKKGFVQYVKDLMEKTGVDPTLFEFEITEDAFMNFTEEVKNHMLELQHLGIRIALDDFGSGYSSLKQLKDLPIDKIKIDRTFIQNVPAIERDQAIIESILDLTSRLNNEIICEGVETKEQVDYLVTQNCLYAQGYYYSKPVNSAELEERWFKKMQRIGS